MPTSDHPTPPDRLQAIESILHELAAAQLRSKERHEARAETVQLLTSDVQQDAENIRALARNSQILHDSIKALESIAAAHEQRIDRIEGQ
jgi:septal ring factor EnvC (AmiA/AmiB activator)